jgi:Raf kinase inhibitor-like YbhB/YbcL family protein
MSITRSLIAASLVAMALCPLEAADRPSVPVSVDRAEAGAARYRMRITSPALQPNGRIPDAYLKISPPLSWGAIPGALTYAVIMEDADAAAPAGVSGKVTAPFVHWLAWNIPANITNLAEGFAPAKRSGKWFDLKFGRNSAGTLGYYGPRPPRGDPPHHYHFQVLAIAGVPNLPAGASREQLLATVKGNVVGRGELVARFPG